MPTLETNGALLHWSEEGQGPPLVLVHGALVDEALWAPQRAAFAEHHRVITFDLRDHGQTRGDGRRLTIELLADDLRALLDGLGLERAAVCGLSLGGMVAQHFAARWPARVSALVLCDTAIASTFFWQDKVQYWLLGAWALAPMVRLLGARRFTALVLGTVRWLRGERWLGHDAATQDYVARSMHAFDTAAMARVYALISAAPPAEVSRITAPTLLLNGAHESRAVFRHAAWLEAHLPDARAVVIPEAGHVSNLENPAAFNAAVLAFLRPLAGPAVLHSAR